MRVWVCVRGKGKGGYGLVGCITILYENEQLCMRLYFSGTSPRTPQVQRCCF